MDVGDDANNDREPLYLSVIVLLLIIILVLLPLLIDIYYESRIALLRSEKALQKVESK